MRALVVVPTYDEAASITELLRQVLAVDDRPRTSIDVLVVDDASPDGTGDLVAAVAAGDQRVHLLRRAGKDGLGAAYRAGLAWGLQRGYQALVQMDADLSHPAHRLPALLAALDGADIAIGSRYVAGGGTRNWPWHRQLISRAGNAYVGLVLRLGVRDATAGFRAFRREVLHDVAVTDLASNGYCFQVETTYRAVRRGARVVEVPITFTERAQGHSKMSSSIVAEALARVTGWALHDALHLPGAGSTDRRGGRSRSTAAGGPRGPRRWRSGALVLLVAAVVGSGVGAALATGHDSDLPDAPAQQAAQGAGRHAAQPAAPGAHGPAAPATAAPTSSPTASSRPGFATSLADGAARTAAVAVPVSVSVPRIGVDSPLVLLGIAPDGSLQVPGHDQFDEAGWLTTSARPGAPGAAVIAGHVDSTSGPAVFFRLRELRAGDDIDVHRADGSTAHFTVEGVQEVGKSSFPTSEVYGPQPGPVLRLVTCGGAFDRATGHYVDNVIVYASLSASPGAG